MKQNKSIPNDPVIANGVGLRKSEWEEINELADKFDLTKNGLAAYAIRYFLQQLRDGKITVETRVTLKIK